MRAYQREFFLQQQTPMLHFQHNQPGATLRATEVKPKLDKFLIAKCGGPENMDKSWFVKDGKVLNYKLRFFTEGVPRISNTGDTAIANRRTGENNWPTVPIVGSYFANMVSAKGLTLAEYEDAVRKGYTETVQHYLPVRMTVLCFFPELMALIEQHLRDFFWVNNFGTRQNKGFGSFVLKDEAGTDEQIAAVLRAQYGAKACYMFRSQKNPLREIQKLYDEIKTGIPREKRGSLLFAYLRQRGIRNEKDYLKTTPVSQWGEVSAEEAVYVRALLGVGEVVTVKSRGADRAVNVTVANVDTDPDTAMPVIQRFPSPVFFKVVGRKVFIVGRRIEEAIYDKQFSFSYGEHTAVLRTPSLQVLGQSFIDDFLAYCYRTVGEEKGLTVFENKEAGE